MLSSTPARWIAPAALAGALVAVIIVASAGGGGSSSSSGATTSTGTRGGRATQAASTTTTTIPKTTAKTYTVRPGDVLSAIAEKTGVPLSDIEQLNPTVDAQSLHAGQKLKLAP